MAPHRMNFAKNLYHEVLLYYDCVPFFFVVLLLFVGGKLIKCAPNAHGEL